MKSTNTTQYLIKLANEPRSAFQDFHGNSGTPHRFLWNDQHQAMILEGREITGEEFDAVADDIFAAEADFSRPVPKRIVTKAEKPKKPEKPTEPAAAPILPPTPPAAPEGDDEPDIDP